MPAVVPPNAPTDIASTATAAMPSATGSASRAARPLTGSAPPFRRRAPVVLGGGPAARNTVTGHTPRAYSRAPRRPVPTSATPIGLQCCRRPATERAAAERPRPTIATRASTAARAPTSARRRSPTPRPLARGTYSARQPSAAAHASMPATTTTTVVAAETSADPIAVVKAARVLAWATHSPRAAAAPAEAGVSSRARAARKAGLS